MGNQDKLKKEEILKALDNFLEGQGVPKKPDNPFPTDWETGRKIHQIMKLPPARFRQRYGN